MCILFILRVRLIGGRIKKNNHYDQETDMRQRMYSPVFGNKSIKNVERWLGFAVDN